MNELSPELEREVREYVRQGKKLHAVKVYKEHMACSLLEAKTAVEEIDRGETTEQPESAVVRSQSGCAGMLVLVAATFGVVTGAITLLLA
ncbi:MAG: hypothetical protein ACF787_03110 [Rhodopirellula sp. JB053]